MLYILYIYIHTYIYIYIYISGLPCLLKFLKYPKIRFCLLNIIESPKVFLKMSKSPNFLLKF